MKRIIAFVLLFAALKVAGQTTGYLRFDTVKIMKQNGTCELYVINKTKDSLGLLTNVGGGLTRFIRPRVINDSTIIIGLDTLTIPGASGGGSPATPDYAIQYRKPDGTFGGDSLRYLPAQNKILTPKDYIQYGRESTGYFQTADGSSSSGILFLAYPRGSSGVPGGAFTGTDSLQPFYLELNTALYDAGESENPVMSFGFGRAGTGRPFARWGLEQAFYDATEFHALSTIPRTMPNPNEEIRHTSYYVSQIDGQAQQQNQLSNITWAESQVGQYYNRQFAVLNPQGFSLASYVSDKGGISVVHGNGATTAIGAGILCDTTNQSVSLYASSTTATLQIGSQSGGTAIDISTPTTVSGNINIYKNTLMNNKEFRVANLANSALGLSVVTSAAGFIFSVSSDGSGYGDTRTTGSFLINRDAGIAASTRLLGIYNNFNADDSLFHVRGNGNLWTKGLVNIRPLKTTLTAPSTEGTIRMVVSDTNGLLSFRDMPQTLDAEYTTQGNSGTGETDLYSYTLPANALSADGQTVNFEIDGEFNDNTATAQIKLYFAGNVTLNTGAVNISTAFSKWRLKGYIIRTSSSTAHVTYELHAPGLATTVFLNYNNLTSLDFTTTNIFKISGQAGGAGGGTSDITAHSWQVTYKPAP